MELKDEVFLLPNIHAQDFISELLVTLKERYDKFSTHSMNEGALFKQGQKDMLGQVIIMLSKELYQKEEA